MTKSSPDRFNNKSHLSDVGVRMGREEYAEPPALVGSDRFPFYNLVVTELR